MRLGSSTNFHTIKSGRDLGSLWSHLVHFADEETEVICLLAFSPIRLKRGTDGLSCLRQEASIWQTP